MKKDNRTLDNPGTIHLPDHHVKVWLEGAALVVRLPDSHTFMLPVDKWRDGVNVGVSVFLDILRERGHGVGTIGMKSSPVHHDVEKLVRDYGKKAKKVKERAGTPEQRERARVILKKAGVIR